MEIKKICEVCKNEFTAHQKTKTVCSTNCQKIVNSHKVFPDLSEYVECKICGFRAKQLLQHVEKVHHIAVEEYCKKYSLTRYDMSIQSLHDKMSTGVLNACKEGRCGWEKGGKNPAHHKDCKLGKRSPWSMNYKGYNGLSDNEKKKKIQELSKTVVTNMNKNNNNPLRIDYYTSRGYSEEEAKKMLSERQCTFSLDTCIEKYGEEEGTKIFNTRQKKWINTLQAKPIEEIERINKAKMMNGRGYSNISQDLFKKLYIIINSEYTEIYYATSDKSKEFAEYMVHNDITKNNYFLDFYVKDNNKVIEFDGDYWHGEKRGNQTRDKKREAELNSLGYDKIFHVRERDYKVNPDKVVNECIEFIRKK